MDIASANTSHNPLKRRRNNITSARSSKRPRTRNDAPTNTPSSPPSTAEQVVKKANSFTEPDFINLYLPPQQQSFESKTGNQYFWTLRNPSNLSDEEFIRCFNLIEETSRADYKASSTGWHPKAKRKEMKEGDMRYLLVRPWRHDQETTARDEDTKNKVNLDGEGRIDTGIVAFASFMLTMEEDQAVIYLYEIHLDDSVRGIGLGKWLMRLVENIGRNVGVDKTMLTVFTRNSTAENFYRRLSYSKDIISPVERKLRGGKVKRPDYLILSKNIA